MAEPFLSEIRVFSFNFAPKGWAMANGQSLPINQNQALFSLLSTVYGGNGQTTFALPNLQERTPVHVGMGLGLGETGGAAAHTLTSAQAGHSHALKATANQASTTSPGGNVLAAKRRGGTNIYDPTPGVTLDPSSTANGPPISAVG